jgi:hypothetical protein
MWFVDDKLGYMPYQDLNYTFFMLGCVRNPLWGMLAHAWKPHEVATEQ